MFCYVFAHLFLCCFSSSKTNETWEEKYFSDSPKTVRSMANHHHQNRFREEIFCITMASRFFPIFGFSKKLKHWKFLKLLSRKKGNKNVLRLLPKKIKISYFCFLFNFCLPFFCSSFWYWVQSPQKMNFFFVLIISSVFMFFSSSSEKNFFEFFTAHKVHELSRFSANFFFATKYFLITLRLVEKWDRERREFVYYSQ